MNFNEKTKVAIFMATFNGESFIREQLDSILNQSFKNWDLFISDDNSDDSTVTILEEYQKKDSRIKCIIFNQGPHGAFCNFYNVMRLVKQKFRDSYDYYFYCDQDDIWKEDKIEIELGVLKNVEKNNVNKPLLCYSDLKLVDYSGKKFLGFLSDFTDINLKNPKNIFFSPKYIWGTTMAHNKKLWNLINLEIGIPNTVSHDNYVGKYAAAFGKIIFINKALVNYRRHENNVTSLPPNYDFISAFKRMFTQWQLVLNNHAGNYWATLFFISSLNEKNDFIIELEKCITKNWLYAWNFVHKYNISISDNIFSKVAFKLILYSGIYKHTSIFKKK